MKKIMIVDDEPDVVDFLAEVITSDKNEAIKVYSGEECLKSVQIMKPDLILLDILMEPVNGWEVLDKLKQNESTKHIPVVILTAKQLEIEDAVKRARDISDYLTKPVDARELKNVIEAVFDLDARMQRVLDQAKKMKISPQAIAAIETKFIPTMRYYSTYFFNDTATT
ncbi:MAG: response regulator [Methanocellales archaeon]